MEDKLEEAKQVANELSVEKLKDLIEFCEDLAEAIDDDLRLKHENEGEERL